MPEVRESKMIRAFVIGAAIVILAFVMIAVVILVLTVPSICKELGHAMKETGGEPVTQYIQTVIQILPLHVLILAIILAVPGVIIPLCVTMWSNYLGNIFELAKYLENRTGHDWDEIKVLSKSLITNSKDTSEKLRVIYIISVCALSISFMFLIISLFFASTAGIKFSIVFLVLCYMALLVLFVLFLVGVYFTLFTHKPFPKMSEIIEKIANLTIR